MHQFISTYYDKELAGNISTVAEAGLFLDLGQ